MARTKLRHTVGDYVTIAISPVLIMALVGSLVYFLVEVLYAGQYGERLQWILFFAVFGIVLIARVSMQDATSDRAGLYGLVLGVLVFIALQRFVDYPSEGPLAGYGGLINFGLLVIIWWCAHRLTWDCTFIDDQVEASGAGVLEAAGLDAEKASRGRKAPEEQATPDDTEPDSGNRKKKRDRKSSPGLLAWWERYRKYRENQQHKPHTPGVWVVYFSLAALPIFGLGQSLIPPEEVSRRRYVFWLMAVYVASGLGLLLTTCYLGLRRYLRQRNLQMPVAMTGLWLTLGGGLVAALLLAGALLPRPNAEYPLVDLGRLAGSADRKASRTAVGKDRAGKGEGRPSSEGKQDDAGKNGGTKAGEDGRGKGESDQGSKQGDSGSGKGQGERGRGGDRSGKGPQPGEKTNSESGGAKKGAQQAGSSEASGSAPRNVFQSLNETLAKGSDLVKKFVFAVGVLIVGFFVARAVLRFLSHFTFWAEGLLRGLEDWWRRLFRSGRQRRSEAQAGEEVSREGEALPSFAAFPNPFDSGEGERRSPEELVRYSFEALQALARERGFGRQADETPLEFAERVGQEMPGLDAEVRKLVGLYARAAYAEDRLPRSAVGVVKQFWERLEAAAQAPMSA